MASLPIVYALSGEIERLTRIQSAVRAWVDALLAMPRGELSRREVEASAPEWGASEIRRLDVVDVGAFVGHDNERERAVHLTMQVYVRRNSTLDGEDRDAAFAAGALVAMAIDAGSTPELVDLGAALQPGGTSSWDAGSGAQNRSVEGVFPVTVQAIFRVVE